MDPEACLRRIEAALIDHDFQEAVWALRDYQNWRTRGGYEPRNGDHRACVAAEAIRVLSTANTREETL